ncbi:unnamed protein product [Sphenostylis stenocarpa]|uniref:Uncharacterized protein n=1 Tax=Sphenostylis stenocarpa TaxID=92480 RepID=A0AA86VD22_9FABA|nr:unnamed protein product [Sphenostylis stenocarpa]
MNEHHRSGTVSCAQILAKMLARVPTMLRPKIRKGFPYHAHSTRAFEESRSHLCGSVSLVLFLSIDLYKKKRNTSCAVQDKQDFNLQKDKVAMPEVDVALTWDMTYHVTMTLAVADERLCMWSGGQECNHPFYGVYDILEIMAVTVSILKWLVGVGPCHYQFVMRKIAATLCWYSSEYGVNLLQFI